ncbi:MAG: sensor histidine kinase [Gemmatimonadota bacterium]
MTDSKPSDPAERALWARWILAWRLFGYAMILVVAGVGWVDLRSRPESRAVFVALLTGFTAWYVLFQVLGRDWFIRHAPWTLLYFAAAWIIWPLLIVQHPVAYALAGLLFPYTYIFLPARLAIPSGFVLGAVMFGAAMSWRRPRDLGSALTGITSIGSFMMLSLYIHAIIRQSRDRQRLIDELRATRHDLARAEREAGVLAERQRLAQEIHDTVAQGFVAVVTHLEAAESALSSDPATVRQHIEVAKSAARDHLTDARRMAWDLRADLTEGDSLHDVVKRLTRAWAGRTGVAAQVVVTGDETAINPDRGAALLQGLEEALRNVHRHAQASTVVVTLSYLGDGVALDVHDNGRGLPAERLGERARDGSGFGLIALKDRIERLGGSASLESTPGEGTTLALEVPLREHGGS